MAKIPVWLTEIGYRWMRVRSGQLGEDATFEGIQQLIKKDMPKLMMHIEEREGLIARQQAMLQSVEQAEQRRTGPLAQLANARWGGAGSNMPPPPLKPLPETIGEMSAKEVADLIRGPQSSFVGPYGRMGRPDLKRNGTEEQSPQATATKKEGE